MLRKLGKRPARHDPRTLKLRNYVMAARLPEVPDTCRWSPAVKQWGMYDNDKVGCCGLATEAHLINSWSHNSADSLDVYPTTEDVLAAYSAVGGYRPGNPDTDQGVVMLEALNHWRSAGLGGHPIAAYASIDPDDAEMICAAIYIFGGIAAGLSLPAAAEGLTSWDMPSGPHHRRRRREQPNWEPGSWGGHAVALVDYDASGLTCVTWGGLLRMDWDFWTTYGDEAYAAVSLDWVGADDQTPNGFKSADLLRDLEAVIH